jgi:hypothetical protein
MIGFGLPRAARVHLGVYDVQGREAAVLADGEYEAGRHRIRWLGAGAVEEPGLYFVRLTVEGRTLVRRAVVLR